MARRPSKSAAPAQITVREMKAALLRSGYLLESRVESALREHGNYVEANPTYPDPKTGQSREFDVLSLGAQVIGPRSSRDYIFPVMLIECVNNSQPLVILTKEPQVRIFTS